MHLHRRLLERSEFPAVWNQDADSIQTSVEIDAHAVLIKLPPRGLRPSPCRGPGAGLGSRWQETWRRLNSHDKHALGTAHAFAHVTAKTDLEPVHHQLGA